MLPQFALSSAPWSLPPLEHVDPPTTDAHAKSAHGFPAWLVMSVIHAAPHYEPSFYGPWNQYLFALFPPSRYFNIKPQALVRPIVEQPAEPTLDGDDDDETSLLAGIDDLVLGDISIGSHGGLHQARGQGVETDKGQPDFLIDKIVVKDDGTIIHVPVAVVEIKRDDDKPDDATFQLLVYMLKVNQQPHAPLNLYGFLLMGDQAIFLEYECRNLRPRANRPDRAVRPVETKVSAPYTICAQSDPVTKRLSKVAVDAWNEPAIHLTL